MESEDNLELRFLSLTSPPTLPGLRGGGVNDGEYDLRMARVPLLLVGSRGVNEGPRLLLLSAKGLRVPSPAAAEDEEEVETSKRSDTKRFGWGCCNDWPMLLRTSGNTAPPPATFLARCCSCCFAFRRLSTMEVVAAAVVVVVGPSGGLKCPLLLLLLSKLEDIGDKDCVLFPNAMSAACFTSASIASNEALPLSKPCSKSVRLTRSSSAVTA